MIGYINNDKKIKCDNPNNPFINTYSYDYRYNKMSVGFWVDGRRIIREFKSVALPVDTNELLIEYPDSFGLKIEGFITHLGKHVYINSSDDLYAESDTSGITIKYKDTYKGKYLVVVYYYCEV